MNKLNSHGNTSLMSLHPGVISHLCEIENDLLKYIFEKREIGTPLAHVDIHTKTGEYSPDFAAKSWIAMYNVMSHFVYCN